jgi:hypothetical protein
MFSHSSRRSRRRIPLIILSTVQHVVWRAWVHDELKKGGARASPALKKAAHAALALTEALVWLESDERAGIDHLLKNGAVFKEFEKWDFEELEKMAWSLARILGYCNGSIYSPFPKDKIKETSLRRGRGRKQGADNVHTRLFKQFAKSLYEFSCIYSARFTLDRLVVSINLLRPYLPTGLVPNVLPIPTLKNIVANKAIATYTEPSQDPVAVSRNRAPRAAFLRRRPRTSDPTG